MELNVSVSWAVAFNLLFLQPIWGTSSAGQSTSMAC